MRIFVEPNEIGLPLTKAFLDKNKNRVENYRCFYIISTNLEPDIYKIGISCRNTIFRLNNYILEHGFKRSNRVTGVRIHYLAGNVYNENVECIKTAIYKLEKSLKSYFKIKQTLVKDRGTERVKMSFDSLVKLIKDFSVNDEITQVRRSTRMKEINDKWKVGDIYKVKWNEEDVEERGGRIGYYKAKITKVNPKSLYFEFENDGYEKRITDKMYNTEIRPYRKKS